MRACRSPSLQNPCQPLHTSVRVCEAPKSRLPRARTILAEAEQPKMKIADRRSTVAVLVGFLAGTSLLPRAEAAIDSTALLERYEKTKSGKPPKATEPKKKVVAGAKQASAPKAAAKPIPKIPKTSSSGGPISSSNAAVLGGLGLALAAVFKVATDKKEPGKAVAKAPKPKAVRAKPKPRVAPKPGKRITATKTIKMRPKIQKRSA